MTKKGVCIGVGIDIAILVGLMCTFPTLGIVEMEKTGGSPTSSSCMTPDCLETTSSILQSLDTSVSPCQDFYEFACKKWVEQTPIPEGKTQIAVYNTMRMRNLHVTKNFLENQSYTDGTRGFELAKTYYNSCLAEDIIDGQKFTPLLQKLSELYGGWALIPAGQPGARQAGDTNYDLKEMLKPTLKYFDSSMLFDLSVGREFSNSENRIIYIKGGSISQRKQYYDADNKEPNLKIKTAYVDFMKSYATMLGVQNDTLPELDKVYDFEKKMADNIEVLGRDQARDKYKFINITELNTICPILDWPQYLGPFFKAVNYELKTDEKIAVDNVDTFKKRCEIITNYTSTTDGRATLHNVAVWSFLWNTKDWMPKSVDEARSGYKIVTEGAVTQLVRWEKCLRELQSTFYLITGRKFVEKQFNAEDKKQVTEMVDQLKTTFKDIIMSQDWMQQEDKEKAVEKVDLMKRVVGYPSTMFNESAETIFFAPITEMKPDTYFENSLAANEAVKLDRRRDLVVKDDEKWTIAADIANARYTPSLNKVDILAGMLQKPYYSSSHPISLNFGGIGMVIGHEITHGFDNGGSKFDGKGNRREWWSTKTREAFTEKTKRMVEQFSGYSFNNKSLNGQRSLGENIADSGGLKIAFLAFKTLQSKHGDNPKLPCIGYTPEQLFFISFGQSLCQNALDKYLMNAVQFGVHTIPRFRAIGSVSNMPEFAEAFQCTAESPMNPAQKSGVW